MPGSPPRLKRPYKTERATDATDPSNPDEELPLSFSQQRLWFLNQWEPANPFYNLPSMLRLSGRLDLAVLYRTLLEVVRRHEILRTSFPSVWPASPTHR